MQFKIWVEVFTTTRFTEEVIDVPDDEWNALTPAEREARMEAAFDDMRNEIANGGWEQLPQPQ